MKNSRIVWRVREAVADVLVESGHGLIDLAQRIDNSVAYRHDGMLGSDADPEVMVVTVGSVTHPDEQPTLVLPGRERAVGRP
jgi:hypothetical protein